MPLRDVGAVLKLKQVLEGDDLRAKYETAINLLGLDEVKFSRIHTQNLKRQHLKYVWLLRELELIASNLNDYTHDPKLPLIEKAYHILLSSPLITAHQDVLSSFSVGLQELDIRSIYQIDFTLDMESMETDQSSLFQSVIFEGPKTSGVEPGFEAFQKTDVLSAIYNQFPHRGNRWNFIADHKADIISLYSHLKQGLPKYLVKSDYRKISNGIVTPVKEDLMRSKMIKNLYEKSVVVGEFATFFYIEAKKRTFTQINRDSMKEVLGNDIVRAYGVPAQEQYLFRSHYDDGRLKLMLKAKWIKGANILGPVYGSADNKSYKVKNVLYKKDLISYIADNSVKNLSECFAPMALLGDPDGIGSSAQNKLCLNGSFVCIDTGHAFDSDIVDQLSDFFTIKDPRFKNYSIFASTRSEIMKGIIKIAYVAGFQFSETVLKSYGPTFYRSVKELVVGSDEKIFDDYFLKFTELREEFVGKKGSECADNLKCCDEILSDISRIKKIALSTRNRFIEKFKRYFTLEQKAVDLIENVEKFLLSKKNTSLRSPDNSVILHHLRVDESAINWRIEILNCGTELCKFNIIFDTPEAFTKASADLAKWLTINNWSQKDADAYFVFNSQRRSLEFSFESFKLHSLVGLFSEEKLKKYFHPKDFVALSYYISEQELLESSSALAKYTKHATIRKHAEEESYVISVGENEKEIDPLFTTLIYKYLHTQLRNGDIFVGATAREMTSTCNVIRTVLFEYERELLISAELTKINSLVQELKQSHPGFNFNIDRIEDKNEFLVHFDVSQCSIILKNIIHKFPLVSGEVNASDLDDISQKLAFYKQKSKHVAQKMNAEFLSFQSYNESSASILGLKVSPLIMSEWDGKVELAFNHNLPSSYVEIATRLFSRFSKINNLYLLTQKDLKNCRTTFELVNQQYLELISDRKKVLMVKIENLNSRIKSFFNIKKNMFEVRFSSKDQNNVAEVLCSVADGDLGELASYFEKSPLKKNKTIDSLCNFIELAESKLSVYEQEYHTFKKLGAKLSVLLQINTEVISLNMQQGVLYLKKLYSPESSSLRSNLDELLADFVGTKGNRILSQLFKNLNIAYEKFIGNVLSFTMTCNNEMKIFLATILSEFSLQATFNLKFVQGRACFFIKTSNPRLDLILNEQLGKKDLDGNFAFHDLEVCKGAIAQSLNHYRKLIDKDEIQAEGFEFIEEESDSVNIFSKLISKLQELSSHIQMMMSQRSKGSYLTTTISNVSSFISSGSKVRNPNLEFKTAIDDFIARPHHTKIISLKNNLESKLPLTPSSDTIQINLIQELQALIACLLIEEHKTAVVPSLS